MKTDWIHALLGGGLIGIAVSLMLLLNGRVTGISGIISGLLRPTSFDKAWRLFFLGGLLLGGLCLKVFMPASVESHLNYSNLRIAIAGLLVGIGTVLGGGCTSGHGICGVSRLSTRSILATILFLSFGIFTVTLVKYLGWIQ